MERDYLLIVKTDTNSHEDELQRGACIRINQLPKELQLELEPGMLFGFHIMERYRGVVGKVMKGGYIYLNGGSTEKKGPGNLARALTIEEAAKFNNEITMDLFSWSKVKVAWKEEEKETNRFEDDED